MMTMIMKVLFITESSGRFNKNSQVALINFIIEPKSIHLLYCNYDMKLNLSNNARNI